MTKSRAHPDTKSEIRAPLKDIHPKMLKYSVHSSDTGSRDDYVKKYTYSLSLNKMYYCIKQDNIHNGRNKAIVPFICPEEAHRGTD
ncbi:MAG: hypothetical protein SCALA701_24500 [Candidatus Scalindua sp.]|nr:MAG: hypothetical protein SCALA701_24500 [Candidatus Scalindua sp.]